MTLPNVPEATQVVGTSGSRALPRVNLLPPEIQEAARFRRFQFAMVAAGIGAVVVVGGLAYNAHHGVTKAQVQLDAAKQQQTTLQSQRAALQSVQDVYDQVSAKKAMLAEAMAPEVRWSYYLNDLSLKIPDHVWLSSVTATESGSTSGPAPAASAATLVPAGLGTVTFAGTAFSHDDVATWLDALAKERGFTNVYFSSSTKTLIGTRPVVNFSSSVTLSPTALSGRFSGEG